MSRSFNLPPLYFATRGQSLTCGGGAEPNSETITLSSELLHQCLTAYADYGDLAKLATVQRGWRHMLSDAVAAEPRYQWDLACALASGEGGLQPNVAGAVRLWRDLVVESTRTAQPHVVTIDPVTQGPVCDDAVATTGDANASVPAAAAEDLAYATRAMKKLSFLHLDGTLQPTAASDNEKDLLSSQKVGMQWLECAFTVGRDTDAAHEMALLYEYGRYGVSTDPVAWATRRSPAV